MGVTSMQLVREGELAAEVAVELIEAGEWGSAIGPLDVQKLDRVRLALRAGDVAAAARDGRVYRLVPQPATGFGEPPQDEFQR
ncbi:hypothetical protein J5J10_07715 [Ciceribacter sp. L1K23]|uniref:hypothetical protein n=1 Tax=Ciceribacter sp. L1K23 TaxID=2820276 RepID=UPI001B8440DF|nr:hypothetical protein [Ciceribacter sp. L1K23]MBR0555566.1 hypothetical protein [Ciceribacter sp. L1K23]